MEKGLIWLLDFHIQPAELAVQIEPHHARLRRRHTAGVIDTIGESLSDERRVAPAGVEVQAMPAFKRLPGVEKDFERLFRPGARPLSAEAHLNVFITNAIEDERGWLSGFRVSSKFQGGEVFWWHFQLIQPEAVLSRALPGLHHARTKRPLRLGALGQFFPRW